MKYARSGNKKRGCCGREKRSGCVNRRRCGGRYDGNASLCVYGRAIALIEFLIKLSGGMCVERKKRKRMEERTDESVRRGTAGRVPEAAREQQRREAPLCAPLSEKFLVSAPLLKGTVFLHFSLHARRARSMPPCCEREAGSVWSPSKSVSRRREVLV